MDERAASISRREALKSTAKIAGVAAFAAPVVVGVFSAPSVSAAVCNPSLSSTAISTTVTADATKGSVNCGAPCNGNGQNTHLGGTYNNNELVGTFTNSNGTVQGAVTVFQPSPGCANTAYYLITLTAGASSYQCEAVFVFENCGGTLTTPASSALGSPVPYCAGDCSSVKLVLSAVNCCPL